MFHGMRAAGTWTDERGTNLLDGGAGHYEVYETADGRHVSLGPLDARSYELFGRLAGLDPLPDRDDRTAWPATKARLAALFKTRTRDEWCLRLEGTDACFAAVLAPGEAPDHPHNRHRGTFVEVDGVVQPAPAPRFSRTAADVPSPPPRVGRDTDAALVDWGFTAAEVASLRDAGAVR